MIHNPTNAAQAAHQEKLRRLQLTKKEEAAAKRWQKAQEKAQVLEPRLDGTFEAAQAAQAALQEAVSDELRAAYTMGGITLDDSQIKALEGMLQNRFAALIGYAGSGKTTVIRFLVEKLKAIYKPIEIRHDEFDETAGVTQSVKMNTIPIAFAAFTGRASEVISSKLPRELQSNVSTIHRLLGYHPAEFEVGDSKAPNGVKTVIRFVPFYDATNKLPYKCIILDEAGMIPAELWNNVLAAITSDCRVYLVGDISQLPPVMGISPLPFAMRNLPTFELATIHRQAEGSPIIANATLIRQGILPNKEQKTSYGRSFVYMPVEAYAHGRFSGEIFRLKTIATIKQLHEMGRFDPWQDIVLVPVAKYESEQGNIYQASAAAFNMELRQLFNGGAERILIKGGMRSFDVSDVAIGDKLMITRNAVVESNTGKPAGVTNGMLGRVISIQPNPLYRGSAAEMTSRMIEDAAKKNISFNMDDLNKVMASNLGEIQEEKENDDEQTRQCSHIVALEILGRKNMVVNLRTAGDFSNLLFAYAITVHKSQGGEYRNVFIMVNPEGATMLLTREWLYTAVTRAKEQCVVMFEPNALNACLRRQRIKGQTLAEKAAAVEAQYQSGRRDAKPIMPTPTLVSAMAE